MSSDPTTITITFNDEPAGGWTARFQGLTGYGDLPGEALESVLGEVVENCVKDHSEAQLQGAYDELKNIRAILRRRDSISTDRYWVYEEIDERLDQLGGQLGQ